MTELVSQELVRSWIAEFIECDRKPAPSGGRADKAVNSLCKTQPLLALETIRAISEQTSAPEVLAVLAAGPLENVLVRHGSKVLDCVVAHARESAGFRELLGGVWSGRISEDVRERLEKALAGLGASS
jgi:hypothetical protein